MIQNAVIKDVKSVAELQEVFDLGSKNRHVASTKMNAESSRSHLVIGIVIESTNLTTGAVLRGKVIIVTHISNSIVNYFVLSSIMVSLILKLIFKLCSAKFGRFGGIRKSCQNWCYT